MSIQATVKLASELAYSEDEDQIIGRINGNWCVASLEDEGRIHRMQSPTFRVKPDGLDPYDVIISMDRAGIDMEMEWNSDIARYEIGGEIIEVWVAGNHVNFK